MARNIPAPVTTARPTLQWANGRTTARTPGGRFGPLVGWHVEVGKSEALDEHCASLGIPQVEIKHMGGAIKAHWSAGETVTIYPLTAGPVADTLRGAFRVGPQMADAGIVAHWPKGGTSYLGLLALADIGGATFGPLIVSASSTLTEHLYPALVDHMRVVIAADEWTGIETPAWLVGLPLGPGDDVEAGRGETTTITVVRSYHPAQVTREYVTGAALPKADRDWARQCMDEAAAWAVEALRRRNEQPA